MLLSPGGPIIQRPIRANLGIFFTGGYGPLEFHLNETVNCFQVPSDALCLR